MSTLEKIVRPIEVGTSPRRIPSEQARSVEKVVLRAGRTGSGRTFSGSFSSAMTFYCEAHDNESRQSSGGEGIKATSRKTHVRRFWQEDEDGSNRNEDVWVDVQRIDELEVTAEPGAQKVTYHTKWYDDDEVSDNPRRKLKTVKIVNPDDDTQFVRVPSIETADWIARPYISRPNIQKPVIVGGEDGVGKPFGFFQGQFVGYQDEKSHFKHEIDDDGVSTGESPREGKVRVVAHRDVEAEPDDNGFFPNDDYDLPTGEGDVDEDQKLNFEFPTRVTLNTGTGVNEQLTYTNLRQEYLFDIFTETPESQDLETGGVTRLDPFQNIINVQWSQEQNVVIGRNIWSQGGRGENEWPPSTNVAAEIHAQDGSTVFEVAGDYLHCVDVAIGPQKKTAVMLVDATEFPARRHFRVYDKIGQELFSGENGTVEQFEGLTGYLQFDSDGNLWVTEGATATKYSAEGVAIGASPNFIRVMANDSWGNMAGRNSDNRLVMVSPNGTHLWETAVQIGIAVQASFDNKGNLWALTLIGDSRTLRKFNHFGSELLTISLGAFNGDRMDVDQKGNPWVSFNTFESNPHATEYDGETGAPTGRQVNFSPAPTQVGGVVITWYDFSAAGSGVTIVAGYQGLEDSMGMIRHAHKDGIKDQWEFTHYIRIPEHEFEEGPFAYASTIHVVAKTWQSKKSPESEPQ